MQRPCVEEAESQLWRFETVSRQADATEGRFIHIQDVDDCLNVNNNALTNGAPVIRWPCGDNPNQVFQVSTDALDQ